MTSPWGTCGWGATAPYGWCGGLLFVVPSVLAFVGLWRSLSLSRGTRLAAHGGADPAPAIVRERYARGEIDADELERFRRELGA